MKDSRDSRGKIEKIIENEYEAYGFKGRGDVRVNSEGEIIIYINSEVPYMGGSFFKFLATLEEKLKAEYEKKEGRFYFDYYIMTWGSR